jgi:hypothetical protein
MTVRITGGVMTSDLTRHRAEWRPDTAADGGGAWVCTRLPTRLLDTDQARLALALAELTPAWG